MLKFDTKKDLQQYLRENLLPMEEARKVTGQSTSAFNQAVSTRRIIPFYQTVTSSGRIQNKLFLKSELEKYGMNKRQ